MTQRMSLDDLMEAMLRKNDPKEVQDTDQYPIPEAIIEELKLRYLDYNRHNRFRPGDIVTPKTGSGSIKQMIGRPMIALETRAAEPYFTNPSDITATSSNEFGKRLDLRVLHYSSGGNCFVAFWVESYEFELWTPAAFEASKRTS